MRDVCYLVMNSRGVTKMTKSKPGLSSGEHAIKVAVNVDNKYFEHAIPTAELTVSEKHLISPVIDVALQPVVEETVRVGDLR